MENLMFFNQSNFIDVICVTSIHLSGTFVVPFVVLKVFIC